MDRCNDIPPDDEFQVELADPNDPDDDGGYVYGEGENEEWHKERCQCELCRVERLELIERVEASRPLCEGRGLSRVSRLSSGKVRAVYRRDRQEGHIPRLFPIRHDGRAKG